MKTLFTILALCILFASSAMAALGDYLILSDIGDYKFITQRRDPFSKRMRAVPGYTVTNAWSGIVQGSDHFKADHNDTTYETSYESDITDMGVKVEITAHAGADSDKWLLHELELCLRDEVGKRNDFVAYRRVVNSDVFKSTIAGAGYYWFSNNITVYIRYGDDTMTKPEPIGIIQAYLNKFPPTLPPNYKVFNTPANDIKWIKEEFERRLWLGDKWLAQIDDPDPKLADKLHEIVGSMNVFLDYREKYYGIAASDEKFLLEGYEAKSDKAAIISKQTEYKNWWNDNKSVAISLTTIPLKQRIINWWKKLFSLINKMIASVFGLISKH